MSTRHIVKQGEHVARLAFEAGFQDYLTVWHDPANAELKKRRQNPHVLFPGDVLEIPEIKIREEPAATTKRHPFVARLRPLKLRIRLLGPDSKPLAGVQVDLSIDGNNKPVTTSGDGMIEELLPRKAQKGSIQFRDERLPFAQKIPIEVRVGDLDPVEEESGQRGRLNALGYDAGDPAEAGKPSLAFRSAVEEFQCDQKLIVDGVVGPQTRKKLQDAYGC